MLEGNYRKEGSDSALDSLWDKASAKITCFLRANKNVNIIISNEGKHTWECLNIT